MIRSLTSLFLLAICLFITSSTTQAQGIQRTFVSTSGTDAGNCNPNAPCRTFGYAMTQTATNGEIIALTSGGYGPVTINKGVQITAPTGVYVAITASSGDAITVNAAGATVVLRGLTLNGLGGTYGINATAVGVLHVENCIVNGFSGIGIRVSLTADSSEIFIKDTIVRNGGSAGIYITTTTGTVRASIDGCRAENNDGNGFVGANNSRVTVRNSIASNNNCCVGFLVSGAGSGATAEMSADNCVASNNATGFGVQGIVSGTATIRVARSMAINNTDKGFVQLGTSTFESLQGTNMVRGNGDNRVGTITTIDPDIE
jgi:hypothetical protein